MQCVVFRQENDGFAVFMAIVLSGCGIEEKPNEDFGQTETEGEVSEDTNPPGGPFDPNDPLDLSVAAGKIIYDNQCAVCHSLGSYDVVGGNGELQGKADNVNPVLLLNNLGIDLTDTELADVKNFIRAN